MNKPKRLSTIGDYISLFILAYLAIISGTFSILILVISIAYYLPKLVTFLFTKKSTKALLINCSIWFLVFGGVTIWHIHISETIKINANKIVLEIEKYHYQNEKYPPSLKEIGALKLAKQYGIYYRNNEGQASLFYRDHWTKFDSYFYSFIKKEWEYWG